MSLRAKKLQAMKPNGALKTAMKPNGALQTARWMVRQVVSDNFVFVGRPDFVGRLPNKRNKY